MSCPICKRHNEPTILSAVRLDDHKTRYRFAICKVCEVAYQEPAMSDEQGLAYNEWGWQHPTCTPYLSKQTSLERARSEMGAIQRLALNDIFDYAAGNGAFVKVCRDAGLTAAGCDAAPTACRMAQDYFDVELSATPPDKTYDTLCLNSILEHVFDGTKLLTTVLPLLKPNGTLVIRTPQFNYQEHGWWAFGPEHICIYSKTATCNLLKQQGYILLHHYGADQSTYVFKKESE